MHSCLVDGGTYMMDQICTPLFSSNTDILVDRAFLEVSAPSDYCLKDQLRNQKVDKVQYRQLLMNVAGLFHDHTAVLNQH